MLCENTAAMPCESGSAIIRCDYSATELLYIRIRIYKHKHAEITEHRSLRTLTIYHTQRTPRAHTHQQAAYVPRGISRPPSARTLSQ